MTEFWIFSISVHCANICMILTHCKNNHNDSHAMLSNIIAPYIYLQNTHDINFQNRIRQHKAKLSEELRTCAQETGIKDRGK